MNKIKTLYPFFICVTLAFLISTLSTNSCTSPTDAEKEITLPDSNLNYTDHIFPLFSAKCGSEDGCHSTYFGSLPANGLDLTQYDNLINHLVNDSEPIIIPGHGAESFLYRILLEPLLGRRQMPPDRAPLSVNNIKGIKTWIDEGAPQFAPPD
jgi:hypothetical protein